MKLCPACGRKSQDIETRCIWCGWQLSKIGYWLYRSLVVVLFPAAIWLLSTVWQHIDRNRVDHEELERAETQLLESFTQRMESLVDLRSQLWRATTSLTHGCPAAPADNNATPLARLLGCATYYETAIEAIDQGVVDISWKVDTLPIVSPTTYVVLTTFKADYWRSCPDSGPLSDCGYRQRAVRIVHGMATAPLTPAPVALKSCSVERSIDEVCRAAMASMKSAVQWPIDDDVNAFFCLIVSDIKNARVDVLTRRSIDIGGDPGLGQLINRLNGNLEASACTLIVAEWNKRHPAKAIPPKTAAP